MKTSLLCCWGIAAALGLSAGGCGYSEDEWKGQLAKYDELSKKNQNLEKELAEAKKRVAMLENELKAKGVDLNKLQSDMDDMSKALEEYKARARQLEAIKARFDLLRKKLDELTKLGLQVRIRKNRMVISLPGDVLFDSGKDTLKKEGLEILQKVATVIKNDPSLLKRDYQVAGHTDNKPLGGGPYKDNYGLSLMRARSVLVHLIGKDGGMPVDHWSAAGYGDTDPVADNNAEEGRQKNRRCDLVVVPDVDEMLDLRSLVR
jgi:chemotaxis protein MotB